LIAMLLFAERLGTDRDPGSGCEAQDGTPAPRGAGRAHQMTRTRQDYAWAQSRSSFSGDRRRCGLCDRRLATRYDEVSEAGRQRLKKTCRARGYFVESGCAPAQQRQQAWDPDRARPDAACISRIVLSNARACISRQVMIIPRRHRPKTMEQRECVVANAYQKLGVAWLGRGAAKSFS
jgi:hypothetical protein